MDDEGVSLGEGTERYLQSVRQCLRTSKAPPPVKLGLPLEDLR